MDYRMVFQHGPIAAQRRKLLHPFIDGYGYVCNKTAGDTLYLQCKKSASCDASGVLIGNVFTLTTGHTHPVNVLDELQYNFENALNEGVMSRSCTSLRVLYDEISMDHPVAAIHSSWIKMKIKMQRWRRKTRPPGPQTWLQYMLLLASPIWASFTEYAGGSLYVAMIQDSDNFKIITYTDHDFLEAIQTNCLYMDATFKTRPCRPKCYQLFTIMAQVEHATIPIFWAVMERKSGNSYAAVLNYFRIVAPHIQPTQIMSDFETGLAAAIRTVFPGASHRRCFFHFVKALRAKMKELRLLRVFEQWEGGKILFRKLCALPLLPANHIGITFEWLVRIAPTNIPKLNSLFAYFRRQWIRRENPQHWSVFDLRNRTNNYIESYHKILRIRFGSRPSIWDFTVAIKNLVALTRREFNSMQMGYLVRENPRSPSARFQQVLQRSWDLLRNNTFNVPSFLNCMICYLKTFNENPLINVNDVDQFVNSDLRDINNLGIPEVQLCTLCNQRLANIISLPCAHTFGCRECAIQYHQFAVEHNMTMLCFCNGIVNELRQVF